MASYDIGIVGGGIVGLATAYRLTERFPQKRVVVIEKESAVAQHQSGRNSGVLHSGIYYRPGTLRASNCLAGRAAMAAFCENQGIPYETCGKVIVATREDELPRIHDLFERGQKNGVRCQLIGPDRLREIEPHAAGLKAIHVLDAGVVDFSAVCARLVAAIRTAGGEIITGAELLGVQEQGDRLVLQTRAGDFPVAWAVTAAGLHCDRVARMTGVEPEARIVPFRGEYYQLRKEAQGLCRTLIYPVPDPRMTFLGVHFTRTIGGGVECGPNAVLAFAREGYTKTTVRLGDLFESLTYPGFLRLAASNLRTGIGETWRSLNKGAFVRALGRLVPEIRAAHLAKAPAGVRGQAILRDGSMVDDFLIQQTARVVNVLNAPSPAATASLAIANTIVDKLATRFE